MGHKTRAPGARIVHRSDKSASAKERDSSAFSHEAFIPQEQDSFSLFQPDTLLADSYLETVRRKSHQEPEKTLMLAVLEDALFCFQKNVLARTEKERALFQKAEDWIMEEDGDWLFSFDSICEVFEINPRYLRKGLLNWKWKRLEDRPRVLKDPYAENQKTETCTLCNSRPSNGHRNLRGRFSMEL